MRRAGYAEQKVVGGEIGFTRRLQQTPFPRLHAYIEERDGGTRVSLHIDQKQPTYGGSRAHGGEYAGPLVEREMERIAAFFRPAAQAAPTTSYPSPDSGEGMGEVSKGGFFSRLFG